MNSTFKTRLILATIVFILTGGLFVYTAAPTVSFWDCGEFVACANILGIPHPPGTPFFMIIARVAILAFSGLGEVAYRLNLLTALSSALACSFAFLFTDRLLVQGFKKKSSDYITYISGFIGAALVALSDTFWFNAVEAEVYGISMCLLLLLGWLSLVWAERHEEPFGDRLLVLICYLAYLGVGFHLTTMVTVPVIFLFILMVDDKLRWNIPLWLTSCLLFSLLVAPSSFLMLAGVAFAIALVGVFLAKDANWKRGWNISLWFAVVAVVGFSTHAYIPIRSALNPAIDENNPEKWESFKGFLERKQYGSESMISRAFYRRADFANQVFTHPHMGYGGYMLAQYLPWKVGFGQSILDKQEYKGAWHFAADEEENEPLVRFGIKFPTQVSFMPPGQKTATQALWFFLFHIPMLFGVYQLYKKNKAYGLYVFLLYVIGSFAMIFYINFSDGTRPEFSSFKQWVAEGRKAEYFPGTVHMEVRERDYFYAVGYIFMGILFAISASVWMENLRKRFGELSQIPKVAGSGLLFLAIAVPLFSNFTEHNRRGMWIPYDYAKNLLESCRPNSVLFTNGDNDTFPLWFMQEVEGVRKDVRVVNLSLVNTDWYISQLLTLEPKLALGFTQEQIANIQPSMNNLTSPVEYTLGKTGLTVTLQARDRQPYYKVQDIMVMNIVQNNYPKRPIHFAVTVSNPNMMGLEKYTIMEGMVYTLTNQIYNQNIDAARTAYLADTVYQYRALGNSGVNLNNDTKGMLSNYFATNHRLARWAQDEVTRLRALKQTLVSAGGDSTNMSAIDDSIQMRLDFGNKYITKTEELMPWDWRHYYFASQYYMGVGENKRALETLEKGMKLGKHKAELSSMLGRLYVENKNYPQAEKLFGEMVAANPDDFQAVFAMSEALERQEKFAAARDVLTKWLMRNGQHQYAAFFKQKIDALSAKLGQAPAPSRLPMPAATATP